MWPSQNSHPHSLLVLQTLADSFCNLWSYLPELLALWMSLTFMTRKYCFLNTTFHFHFWYLKKKKKKKKTRWFKKASSLFSLFSHFSLEQLVCNPFLSCYWGNVHRKTGRQMTWPHLLMNKLIGNPLVVQCLELHAFTAEGLGLIPSQGTKIPKSHTAWHSKNANKWSDE